MRLALTITIKWAKIRTINSPVESNRVVLVQRLADIDGAKNETKEKHPWRDARCHVWKLSISRCIRSNSRVSCCSSALVAEAVLVSQTMSLLLRLSAIYSDFRVKFSRHISQISVLRMPGCINSTIFIRLYTERGMNASMHRRTNERICG